MDSRGQYKYSFVKGFGISLQVFHINSSPSYGSRLLNYIFLNLYSFRKLRNEEAFKENKSHKTIKSNGKKVGHLNILSGCPHDERPIICSYSFWFADKRESNNRKALDRLSPENV